MALGWVYLLTNPAMPGLVKIGQSSADPDLRSNELFTTGVPDQFVVAYKGLFNDYSRLERTVHSSLTDHRHRRDREFFRIEVGDAVRAIQSASEDGAKYEVFGEGSNKQSKPTEASMPTNASKPMTAGQIERERRRKRRLGY